MILTKVESQRSLVERGQGLRCIMRQFENLEIWKDSKDLVLQIYSNLKDNKDFGFRDQIQRAAVSIMNNIAEGSEYGSDAVFIRYLKISKSSCAEVRSMLYLCESLDYIAGNELENLKNITNTLSKKISGLIKYLQSNQ